MEYSKVTIGLVGQNPQNPRNALTIGNVIEEKRRDRKALAMDRTQGKYARKFIREKCCLARASVCKPRPLYAHYVEWLGRVHLRFDPVGYQEFTKLVEEQGYKRQPHSGYFANLGVRLEQPSRKGLKV